MAAPHKITLCLGNSTNGFSVILPASNVIRQGPGFKKIVIAPSVVGDLTAVSASYDSIAGKIVSEWKRTGSNVTYHVIIPPNTTATVYVPPESLQHRLPYRLRRLHLHRSPPINKL